MRERVQALTGLLMRPKGACQTSLGCHACEDFDHVMVCHLTVGVPSGTVRRHQDGRPPVDGPLHPAPRG